MATKTISLKVEAYEKLRAAKRSPDESFTQVVLRASWPEETIRAGDLLRRSSERRPRLSVEILDRLDELKLADMPAEDKWKTPSSSKRPS